ncbi:Uu.00g006150.m01.CDS01 [Anthostomella pinea]|uniref:Uu.00g006150.m01.CDS01 n=1 Tax=Anthostomella pinea TaxID=933095 RepID=A0AAI8VK98_9PEZI|nr:Uu.00g006150.m01.CDS01 [Anthostomella pinea]
MDHGLNWTGADLADLFTSGWNPWVICCAVGYLSLCMMLRNRRTNSMQGRLRLRYGAQGALAGMTLEEAYAIKSWLAEQEFPRTLSMVNPFALFKSYGIPSISGLFARAGQNAHTKAQTKSTKKKLDSSVVLANMMGRPGSQEAVQGIARVNYIHSFYRPSGKISDDDLLYTLSLFTLEIVRWVDSYEWRRLTDIERCAIAVFHKALGDELAIPYDHLPSQRDAWRDGLHWLSELDVWARAYEEEHMKPSEAAARMGNTTMDRWLQQVQTPFKTMGRKMVSVAMGPRLREAMGVIDPPPVYEVAFNALVRIRKVFLRHLRLRWPGTSLHINTTSDAKLSSDGTMTENMPHNTDQMNAPEKGCGQI